MEYQTIERLALSLDKPLRRKLAGVLRESMHAYRPDNVAEKTAIITAAAAKVWGLPHFPNPNERNRESIWCRTFTVARMMRAGYSYKMVEIETGLTAPTISGAIKRKDELLNFPHKYREIFDKYIEFNNLTHSI